MAYNLFMMYNLFIIVKYKEKNLKKYYIDE